VQRSKRTLIVEKARITFPAGEGPLLFPGEQAFPFAYGQRITSVTAKRMLSSDGKETTSWSGEAEGPQGLYTLGSSAGAYAGGNYETVVALFTELGWHIPHLP
jgi:hypothetical protein